MSRQLLQAVFLMAGLAVTWPAMAEEAPAPAKAPPADAAPASQSAEEAAVPAPDPESLTVHLFDRNLMAGVGAPLFFTYDLVRQGGPEPAGEGHVRMGVSEVAADGHKSVYFKTDGAFGTFDFGPVDSNEQNPLVIVYLQRDVAGLQRLTGGSQQYFRNRIRQAFNGKARIETVPVTFKGKQFEGERLTIQPFLDDAHLSGHPEIKAKSYSFTVVPELPGGIYQIATRVPDPNNADKGQDDALTLVDTASTE